MNLLFIGLITLFMSHEQCNRCWTLIIIKNNKKKPKNVLVENANANVGANRTLGVRLD